MWNFKEVENTNIHELMTFLAHEIDYQNLETVLRKGENVKQL